MSLRSANKFLPAVRQRVSVIICARNEAANLAKNLPFILTQSYKDNTNNDLFEVIVVNDNSIDDTQRVLTQLEKKYPHLRSIVSMPEDAGKKGALNLGVSLARYDNLLLTDADCVPASNNWLQFMTAPLTTGMEIVAGYSGFYKTKSLLNAFIRWETTHTFLQYSTYAASGIPYMAVGRNLACTRQVLQKAMQHPLWKALPSGDDDLLIRIAATANNTVIVSNPQAFTSSPAKNSLLEWRHQKQRHLSTGKYYKSGIKFMLGSYASSHAAMWLTFFVLLFSPFYQWVLLLFAIRCCLYWPLWVVSASKLKESGSVYFYPLFDLGWMMYNFAFLPYITWKNKKNWK